jgi:hypothetical protein
MSTINWNDILPAKKVRVLFSYLRFPNDLRTEIDRSVAAIKLNDGKVIEVEWIDDKRQYLITVYSKSFRQALQQFSVSSPSDVVESVKNLVYVLSPSQSTVTYSSGNTACTSQIDFELPAGRQSFPFRRLMASGY